MKIKIYLGLILLNVFNGPVFSQTNLYVDRIIAKIGGEMISLTAIEQFLSAYWPEKLHAVITVPDDKKGEALLVITECRDLDRTNLAAQAKSAGLADISIPKQIRYVDAIPILGTGKIDYQSLLNESS